MIVIYHLEIYIQTIIFYYRIAWLSNEGSPGSKIERCDLMNFEYLARKEFNGFSIRF